MSYTPPIGDASENTKGVIRLAGDLAGDASAPTVPELAKKANLADVYTKAAADATFVLTSQKGTASGVASLDSSGLVPTSQLPTQPHIQSNWLEPDDTNSAYIKNKPTIPTAIITSTDNTLGLDTPSDTIVPSQKAVKNYVDAKASISMGAMPLLQARKMTAPETVITRFQPGHGWTCTNGSDDTSVYLFGNQSMKATASGTSSYYIDSPALTQNLTKKIIRIIFRVNDTNLLTGFECYLTCGNGNILQTGIDANMINNEWNIITFPVARMKVVAGNPDPSNVTKISIVLNGSNSGTLVFNINAIETISPMQTLCPNGIFILEADDGYATWKSKLLPITSARGVPVTINPIISYWIGSPSISSMTPADMIMFADKHGWATSCHAYDSTIHSKDTASIAELEADIIAQRGWFMANGLTEGANHIALGPDFGSPVAEGPKMDLIRKYFASCRTNGGYYETAIPADQLRLRSLLWTSETLDTLKLHVDRSAVTGGVFILTVHNVDSGPLAIPSATLSGVLDYAQSKSMRFMTRPQWLQSIQQYI